MPQISSNNYNAKAEEVLDELMIQVNQHVARNSRLQLMILQVQPFEKTPTHED